MMQKYKVFFNNLTIHFIRDYEVSEFRDKSCYMVDDRYLKQRNPEEIIEILKKTENLLCVSMHPGKTMCQFLHPFKKVDAAGGFILNDQSEILMIFRHGIWDLPKGKKKKTESFITCAAREISEETGVIPHLDVVEDPFITHHIYHEKDRWNHKTTYWYKGCAGSASLLVPQVNESITEVCWANSQFVKHKVAGKTFPLIEEVLGYFSKH
jgi:8-oxo-dGTP pyrophosphatase MutT (NUDIX family)